jgi:hypothetical protein
MKRSSRSSKRSAVSGVSAALTRAARQAREIAAQSGTPLVIYENGAIVRERVVDAGAGVTAKPKRPRRQAK